LLLSQFYEEIKVPIKKLGKIMNKNINRKQGTFMPVISATQRQRMGGSRFAASLDKKLVETLISTITTTKKNRNTKGSCHMKSDSSLLKTTQHRFPSISLAMIK
jgi:hypothetical protein